MNPQNERKCLGDTAVTGTGTVPAWAVGALSELTPFTLMWKRSFLVSAGPQAMPVEVLCHGTIHPFYPTRAAPWIWTGGYPGLGSQWHHVPVQASLHPRDGKEGFGDGLTSCCLLCLPPDPFTDEPLWRSFLEEPLTEEGEMEGPFPEGSCSHQELKCSSFSQAAMHRRAEESSERETSP